ncbi:methionyl-tRNA formyltransferase [Acetanaerobacterium elongatum]|uniref:Methionyl-tRNA formyltransferase n=1 Tax=Acetanaerobacterium elongatum TaxID=258515 RepID=A0A1G9VNI5_9FIRM|nr:methionyl-tRNA formyltransferase [Acetanaerobacterium elongatum]SDM73666.1 methionyl-tRNA formyltransferase [Acetanaerobacterium elongatum]
MNIIFMGTPEFAVPCLDILVKDGHAVTSVYTQPDKPVGRRQVLTPPAVKVLAQSLGIPVYQPNTLKGEETAAIIAAQNPDVIVVTAYGKLLPRSVLEIPKHGCINVHASLLPKYRGAGPIQWSVINGEQETGVTTMYMAQGLDTGDMILKCATAIGPEETAGELHDRLSILGAQLLSQTLRLVAEGKAPREVQNDTESCYAPMLSKEMALIDFSKPAWEVHNLIRGLSPWPVAYTLLDGKALKVHRARISDRRGECGVLLEDGALVIGCGGNTAIELLEVQYEGGKRMTAELFLRGHRLQKGLKF